MIVQLKQLVFGVKSLIFSNRDIEARKSETSLQSTTSDYCYSVWLRHLSITEAAGLNAQPKVIVELGPGNSLGVGLMALLTGSERYIALDVVRHQWTQPIIEVFDELVELLQKRAPLAGTDTYPDINPQLDDNAFPSFLSDERMTEMLRPERISILRKQLQEPDFGGLIDYRVPWKMPVSDIHGHADFVISQATLEYVPDPEAVYREMVQWLSPNGHISVQVDFRCKGFSRKWYGHWAMTETRWKLVVGNRAYSLNRQSLSGHRAAAAVAGLKIITEKNVLADKPAPRRMLAKRFRENLSNEDLGTTGSLIVAQRATLGAR